MDGRAQGEVVAAELELEIARVCGVMNATTGRLVGLIARVLETEAWQGHGIRSASHWVTWKCGVSPARARRLVLLARRLGELPETRSALEAGELWEDQVVLGSIRSTSRPRADPTEPNERETPEEPRRVSFGNTETGSWRLSAELPADEGAVVERALVAARDELFRAGEHEPAARPAPSNVDWADALVAMADRCLSGATRPHHERHTVLLHIGVDVKGETSGHLHSGRASAKVCAASSAATPGCARCSRRAAGR